MAKQSIALENKGQAAGQKIAFPENIQGLSSQICCIQVEGTLKATLEKYTPDPAKPNEEGKIPALRFLTGWGIDILCEGLAGHVKAI